MIDLSNNRIPFGLLTEEEQYHLRNWKGEVECFSEPKMWSLAPAPTWHFAIVYRTVSPPKREERFVVWDGDGDAVGANNLVYANVHKRGCGGTIYRITRNEDGSDPQIEEVNDG